MKKILIISLKVIVAAIAFVAYILNKEIGFIPSGILVFILGIIVLAVFSINSSNEKDKEMNQ